LKRLIPLPFDIHRLKPC